MTQSSIMILIKWGHTWFSGRILNSIDIVCHNVTWGHLSIFTLRYYCGKQKKNFIESCTGNIIIINTEIECWLEKMARINNLKANNGFYFLK